MPYENDEGTAYLLALQAAGGSTAEPASAAPLQTTTPETHSAHAQYRDTQHHDTQHHDSQYQGGEKRRTPRYKCEGSAAISEAGCDVHTWANFTDISLHGCYLEAQATYPVGTVLHMKLQVSDRRLDATGVVRINYPYLGMGIAFVEMTESDRAELKQLLASISPPMIIMAGAASSSRPGPEPVDLLPQVSDPSAAVQALIEFFEDRQIIVREDFLRILRQSQKQKHSQSHDQDRDREHDRDRAQAI